MARLESRLEERINASGIPPGWEHQWRWNLGLMGWRRQFGELRERMAHLEGLLEGLREAITGRAAAS